MILILISHFRRFLKFSLDPLATFFDVDASNLKFYSAIPKEGHPVTISAKLFFNSDN